MMKVRVTKGNTTRIIDSVERVVRDVLNGTWCIWVNGIPTVYHTCEYQVRIVEISGLEI